MTHHNAHHRIALVFAFLVFLCGFFLLTGCAIPPSGPVVSHTIHRYEGRPDGLIAVEEWRDKAFSHGWYLFVDPTMQNINTWHTNQAALGGCSYFSASSVTITVDTNTAAIIGAGGTAAGNIIGAAAKAAVK
jgi:hypothetical protein